MTGKAKERKIKEKKAVAAKKKKDDEYDPIVTFENNDFKKSADSSFCTRLRGKAGVVYGVQPDTFAVSGGVATAKVVREDDDVAFDLTLTAYKGVVRLLFEEAAVKGRYSVQDVLLAELPASATDWTGSSTADDTAQLQLGDTSVTVTYKPFRLDISVGGVPAMSFNSRQMLNYEETRPKKAGEAKGTWGETFLSHRDTKPKGPQALSFDVTFPDTQHVFGIPERATRASLKPTVGSGVRSEPYRMYNLDVFEHLAESPFGLYGSVPFLTAHKAGQTSGVFWLNASEMYVDVGKPQGEGLTYTNWLAESGQLDLFFLTGPNPAAVQQQYAQLTGTTALPQLFSLGYHQCRWNYKDDADVREVDQGFDTHAIPYDVIWLDIEHTDGKKYMTWDKKLFPDPIKLQNDIGAKGRKMVTIVDPHVKREASYALFAEAQDKGFFTQTRSGEEFDGWCWPGSSSYLDMLNPEVRDWWSTLFSPSKYEGSTEHLYIWNDMNEPSVFNGPEMTMPKDNLHLKGSVEHRDVHNLYGFLYHAATAEGLVKRGLELHGENGDRPFVLSRAFFAGTQRVGPVWTGDNTGEWSYLKLSIPMLIALNLTGISFSGADVGGFFGNPGAELMTRWYQLGAFYPFFRGHAHLDTKRREPWLFGERSTSRIREAIRCRYALLPYLYTLFHAAHVSGLPVMRPLWFEFPDEPALCEEEYQFLLGPALLVAPVLAAGAQQIKVTLPRGATWYDGASGAPVGTSSSADEDGGAGDSNGSGGVRQVAVDVTLDSIPTFLRGGSILPKKETLRSSSQGMANDPLTLIVALDSSGSAQGDVYIDDGRSFAYQSGTFISRRFTYRDGQLSSATLEGVSGSYETPVAVERIVLLGLDTNKKYTVENVGTGEKLKLERGTLNGSHSDHALALHTALPVGSDWTLAFTSQ